MSTRKRKQETEEELVELPEDDSEEEEEYVRLRIDVACISLRVAQAIYCLSPSRKNPVTQTIASSNTK